MNANTDESWRFGFGALGIYICLSGIRSLYQEWKLYEGKHNAIMSLSRAQRQNGIGYDELQRNPNSELLVLYRSITPSDLKPDTLVIRRREKLIRYRLNLTEYYPNVTGGEFAFKTYNKNQLTEVTCKINNTLISSSILDEKLRPVKVFGYTQPIVYSSQIKLSSAAKMTLIGLLTFDLETGKFTLTPEFMGESVNQFLVFVDNKKIDAALLIGILGMVLPFFIYLVYSPVKKFIRKIINKQEEANNSYFKKVAIFKANPANKLSCIRCQENPTEISYECGHIMYCNGCHLQLMSEKDYAAICPDPKCKKVSKKFIKFYFS